MMNQPPIDELAAKTDGNKYKLCTVIAKRAKETPLNYSREFLIFYKFFINCDN